MPDLTKSKQNWYHLFSSREYAFLRDTKLNAIQPDISSKAVKGKEDEENLN